MTRSATARHADSTSKALMLWSPRWIRDLFAVMIAAVLAAAAIASPAHAQQGQPGYVDTIALNLRVDAGTKAAIVGILLKYDVVSVLGRKKVGRSTWYEIEASGGYTNGFVAARYIQFGAVPDGAGEEEILDYGAEETPTLMRGAFKYVGPGACAECHEDSTGRFPDGASSVWGHTVHSATYKTLRKGYTIEISKRKRNIDDPINDWRCVKCHVTAYGAAPSQLGPGYSHEDGVSCEVCHGPGGSYADADHGPDNPNRADLGFRILNNLTDRREVCTSCHNAASPTYKPFNLREFSRSIAHWIDPGDKFYYQDAVSEAKRRQHRVADKRAERTSAMMADSVAADTARLEAEMLAAAKVVAQREEERKRREAAAAQADAAERARLQKEQEAADAQAAADAEAAAAKAQRDVDARAKAQAAAQKQLEAEERQARARERQAAEAAIAAEMAAQADQERKAAAARKKFEEQARAAASNATGVASFLEDVDDVIQLNTQGVKYLQVDFPHLAHASKQYLPNGQCADCHHTQEGEDAPEACSTCHEIGGDADEEKQKTRAVHTKNKGFPRTGGQEETSCVGCHKSQNALLTAGSRTGEPAPTKCTACHKRKR